VSTRNHVSWYVMVVLMLSSGAVGVAVAQPPQPSAGAITAAKKGYPKYRITDVGISSGVNFNISSGSRPLDGAGELVGYVGNHVYLWSLDGTPRIDVSGSISTDVFGISGSGKVTGFAQFGAPSTNPHAFLWKHDGTAMMDLGALGSASNDSIGWAVNDLGQVTGTSGNRAFLWKNDGGPMRDLGTLGGTTVTALALNDSGQVTGYSATNGTRVPHAFLWKNDGTPMVDLGPRAGKASFGRSINASGEVTGNAWAGVSNNATFYHAYLWRNDGTAPVELDKTGGAHTSSGEKINDAGQVMGSAWSTTANAYHAFVWRSNGSAVDLGTLGGTRVQANDMNNAGWVVGASTRSPADNSSYTAYLWIDNGQGIQNLNDLIDPADPLRNSVYLSDAFAINDAGDIAVISSGGVAYILRGSQLALDPTSLAFGGQKVGSSSAPRTVTVQNRTDAVVAITNIKLGGSGASQFAYTSTCGSSVPGNGSCAIKVSFKPASTGAKLATLSVNGGGNGLRVVNLAGKGT
jgi:probable HAF family extracellular repeat protein